MEKLSMEHVHFSDYEKAGFNAERVLYSFALLQADFSGMVSGTLESIIQTAKTTGKQDSLLTKENIQNLSKVLNLNKKLFNEFIGLYSECAEFFERSSILTEQNSGFSNLDLEGDWLEYFEKNLNLYKELSNNELKCELEKFDPKGLCRDLNDILLKDMLGVWHDENANVVCQECNKLYDNYEEAYILFKNGVEDFFARLENLEQGQESVQTQEEKQEYSKSLQELEDKILTNEETGKSYLVLDIPDEEIKEEQEDNKVKTNKETRKSYLVIEDEMSL